MNILFYTPLNTRCRDLESQAREFERNGHSILLLTISSYHLLHQNFLSYGYKVASAESSSSFVYPRIFQRLFKFVAFCRKNSIDVVYSHLEPANFIAVLGQYFVRARIVVCRHHMDFAKLAGFDTDFSYRLTYKLAKDIIVVSKQAKEYMIKEEGIPQEKIHQINLAYDFNLYGQVNTQKVQEITQHHQADILLLTIGRLNRHKRPGLSIRLVKELTNAGLNIKLLILGEGVLLKELQNEADLLGVSDRVFFTGYVGNAMDYMAAADFLVHPSVSESSCISIKEAGLAGLPPIVCRSVGDFDEIIQDGENGFLVGRDEFVKSAVSIIQNYAKNKSRYRAMGEKLRATINERFDIQKVAPYYEKTFHQLG